MEEKKYKVFMMTTNAIIEATKHIESIKKVHISADREDDLVLTFELKRKWKLKE